MNHFLVFIFFISTYPPTFAATFTPPTEECVDSILSLPKEIEREVVEVPEYYIKPDGTKIHQLLAHDLDPEKDGKLDLDFLRKQLPAVTKEISLEDFLVAVVPARELPGGLLNKWSCEKAKGNFSYMNFKKSGHNWMDEEKIWVLLNKNK